VISSVPVPLRGVPSCFSRCVAVGKFFFCLTPWFFAQVGATTSNALLGTVLHSSLLAEFFFDTPINNYIHGEVHESLRLIWLGILKNNEIALFFCFTFILETGVSF